MAEVDEVLENFTGKNERKETKGPKKGLGSLLKMFDILGQQVTLTTNGSSFYKTGFGGFMTCLSFIIVFVYGLALLIDMIVDGSSTALTIEVETLYMPQILAPKANPLMDKDFFFGMGNIDQDISEYGTIKLFHMNSTTSKNSNNESEHVIKEYKIDLVPCEKLLNNTVLGAKAK